MITKIAHIAFIHFKTIYNKIVYEKMDEMGRGYPH